MSTTKHTHNKSYPESAIDLSEMNRVVRHRLRNLCAGVKMTMDRIAQVTAETHPQLTPRCDVVKGELDSLQLFTERMDLLFDTLPAFDSSTLFELIAELRNDFSRKFAFCNLGFDGPQLDLGFKHGSWVLLILKELLDNAGAAASIDDESVCMSWACDSGFSVEISNPGSLPELIPTNPPQPFFTQKSRHDGLGLAIVCRICQEIDAEFRIQQVDQQVITKVTFPEQELIS